MNVKFILGPLVSKMGSGQGDSERRLKTFPPQNQNYLCATLPELHLAPCYQAKLTEDKDCL